jgi:pyruvate/2-oxoglutarate/acetoin dehydrogenase E1 component
MGTINKAMLMLAEQPNAVFVGQGVRYGGVATYRDLEGVPDKQRIEFPVAEELQLGCCIGLSLQGYLPICIFPRMDFMLRAADQLVNHLDKLAAMSCGQFVPKVIIRTRVGSKTPLDAGPQHTNDHTDAFDKC